MHRHGRPLRMRIHPILHPRELLRRILPENPARRRRAARRHVGDNFLSVHGIADAAIDAVRLMPVRVDIQAASLNLRHCLRPLLVGVILPGLSRAHHQHKDRAQPGKQTEKRREQQYKPAPLRQILQIACHRHLPPKSIHATISRRAARWETDCFKVSLRPVADILRR